MVICEKNQNDDLAAVILYFFHDKTLRSLHVELYVCVCMMISDFLLEKIKMYLYLFLYVWVESVSVCKKI